MEATKIAIVGMGAVGTTAGIHLIKRLHKEIRDRKVQIHCFEKKNVIGAGLAHSTKKDFHILNVRADSMSLFREKPQDFVEWLREEKNGFGAPSSEYVPRHLFGSYIKQRFEQMIAIALGSNVEIYLHFEEVTDCQEYPEHVQLTVNGRYFLFDHAILCPGHLPKKSTHHEITENPRYLNSPWEFERFKAIDSHACVGILGTSLTAIDVLLTLENSEFQGSMVCFSRTRGLPKIQSHAPPLILKHLTFENLLELSENFTRKISLSAIAALLKKDFLAFAGGEILWNQLFSASREDTLGSLPASLQDVERGHYTWHSVLDATTEVITYVWWCLEDKEKKIFLERYESIWAMFRHSMPSTNAQKIFSIAKADRLAVVTGLKDISFDEKKQAFKMSVMTNGKIQQHWVDFLINATGPNLSLQELNSAVLRNMLKRGQLLAHPLGGVDVDFISSRLRFRDYTNSRRIRFVGILTKGVHFYTNSFEMNRNNVVSAVEEIVVEIARKKTIANPLTSVREDAI